MLAGDKLDGHVVRGILEQAWNQALFLNTTVAELCSNSADTTEVAGYVQKTLYGRTICVDMLLFDYPVVNGCLFCCLSCPVCMEAMYRCSAMPCVPKLLGGNFAPLPADKSGWHIHQFVRVHIPWHIHQT